MTLAYVHGVAGRWEIDQSLSQTQVIFEYGDYMLGKPFCPEELRWAVRQGLRQAGRRTVLYGLWVVLFSLKWTDEETRDHETLE